MPEFTQSFSKAQMVGFRRTSLGNGMARTPTLPIHNQRKPKSDSRISTGNYHTAASRTRASTNLHTLPRNQAQHKIGRNWMPEIMQSVSKLCMVGFIIRINARNGNTRPQTLPIDTPQIQTPLPGSEQEIITVQPSLHAQVQTYIPPLPRNQAQHKTATNWTPEITQSVSKAYTVGFIRTNLRNGTARPQTPPIDTHKSKPDSRISTGNHHSAAIPTRASTSLHTSPPTEPTTKRSNRSSHQTSPTRRRTQSEYVLGHGGRGVVGGRAQRLGPGRRRAEPEADAAPALRSFSPVRVRGRGRRRRGLGGQLELHRRHLPPRHEHLEFGGARGRWEGGRGW